MLPDQQCHRYNYSCLICKRYAGGASIWSPAFIRTLIQITKCLEHQSIICTARDLLNASRFMCDLYIQHFHPSTLTENLVRQPISGINVKLVSYQYGAGQYQEPTVNQIICNICWVQSLPSTQAWRIHSYIHTDSRCQHSWNHGNHHHAPHCYTRTLTPTLTLTHTSPFSDCLDY